MNSAPNRKAPSGRFCTALNFVLAGLFIAEAFVAWGLYARVRFPVPDSLAERILAVLDSRGVSCSAEEFWFGADFSLYADAVSMRLHGTPEAFFKARRIRARINPFAAGGDDFGLRAFSVDSAEVFSPFKNPQEASARIVSDINVSAHAGVSSYALDYLRGTFMGVDFELSGRIDKGATADDFRHIAEILSEKLSAKTDKKVPQKKLSAAEIAEAVDDACADNGRLQTILRAFKNPRISAEFGFLASGGNFANMFIRADSVDTSALLPLGISAEETQLGLTYANSKTSERIRLECSARRLACGGFPVSARNVGARAGVNVGGSEIALFDVDVSAAAVDIDGTSLDNILVSKKLLSRSSFDDGWYFFASGGANRFGGKIALPNLKRVEAEFSGNICADEILSRRELAGIPEMRDFSFPHGVNIDGRAAYVFGEKFPTASVSIDASDCIVMRLDLDGLSADVEFGGGVLKCANIVAKSKEGWGATGAYVQSFLDDSYDISVKGNLRPMAIAHFMEPWWTRVMGAFSFENGAKMPYADVRVEGVWGAPENIWCFGYVEGENAVYDGAKFDAFSTYIWVSPLRITLYDVQMFAGDRRGECFIEWLYDKGEGLTSYDRQRLLLKSTLSPAELIALGGDDAREVLDIVKFQNPPNLELNALMFNPSNNPQKRADIFNAKISARGDVDVEMIKLLSPSFSAVSDKTTTVISDAAFGFCGGSGSGGLRLEKRGKTVSVDGEARALKMNQGRFFDFLESLGGETPDGGAASAEFVLGGDASGEVSATLKLRGDVDNMSESVGGGTVSIKNRDFLKLNIFGLISKAFSAIGVPVGSFDIAEVDSEFSLGGGQLRLSPLSMSGPSMRIIGAAAYNFKDDSVRGELKTYPFDNVSNRIISAVNKLVNPIMDTVRVKISGTLSDPNFSAKITPADVIRSEEKVIERIDKSL